MNLGEPCIFHFPQAIVLIDLYSLFYSLCFWSGPWKHLNLRRALFLCSTIFFYPCKSLRFMNSCPGIINYLYTKFKHISLKNFILKNVFGLKLRSLVLNFFSVFWKGALSQNILEVLLGTLDKVLRSSVCSWATAELMNTEPLPTTETGSGWGGSTDVFFFFFFLLMSKDGS